MLQIPWTSTKRLMFQCSKTDGKSPHMKMQTGALSPPSKPSIPTSLFSLFKPATSTPATSHKLGSPDEFYCAQNQIHPQSRSPAALTTLALFGSSITALGSSKGLTPSKVSSVGFSFGLPFHISLSITTATTATFTSASSRLLFCFLLTTSTALASVIGAAGAGTGGGASMASQYLCR